jgi:hypothetical protein
MGFTSGCVEAASNVALQHRKAVGRVAVAGVVVKERERSVGRVGEASRIEQKRCSPSSRISVCYVQRECPGADPVLKLAVVARNSETQPIPVLPEPVVRLLSAFYPSAVVKLG